MHNIFVREKKPQAEGLGTLNGGSGQVGIWALLLLSSNSCHDVLYDRLHFVGRQSEGSAVGDDANGFARTVHNHLARFALMEMFLEFRPNLWAGCVLYVISKLGKKFSASKHQDSRVLRMK